MQEKTSQMIQKKQGVEPYISASTHLPEITPKAIILGILLAIMMAGSNAYLVLKVGMSVSACIPAAVISMAALRMFKNSNILENNIVQTAASAGEVLAGALAFTIPALIMIGYWHAFPYGVVASLTAIGGLLGVLLSVPLRRAMILDSDLKFPEGIATAEVLKAGNERTGARAILFAGIAAATIKFCQSGFQVLADSINIWGRVGNTVTGVTAGFSLALVGAGYIVGLSVTLTIFVGAILAWFIGVPVYGAFMGLPVDATDAYGAAVEIWNTKIRIIGVGMMVFGGICLMGELIKPLRKAIATSLEAVKKAKTADCNTILRTEHDIPITYVAFGSALLILPMYMTFNYILATSGIQISPSMIVVASLAITFLAFILGMIGSSLAAYMCGSFGSSNSPFSGLVLMGILTVSVFLLVLLGVQVNFSNDSASALGAAGLTILVGCALGSTFVVGGDNLQDLKSGQLVGATPWRQQVMLIVGVLASAMVLPCIFQLLFEAYGFGEVLPRPGMDPAQALAAPKAAIMAAVAQAIFTHTMDWTMILIGVGLGTIILLLNWIIKFTGMTFKISIVSIAVGIYMPLDVTVPLLCGGLLSALALKALKKEKGTAAQKASAERQGVLFASGLIAGEALVGILIAIPFVAYQDMNVFKIVPDALKGSTDVLGLVVFGTILYWFYRMASKVQKQ